MQSGRCTRLFLCVPMEIGTEMYVPVLCMHIAICILCIAIFFSFSLTLYRLSIGIGGKLFTVSIATTKLFHCTYTPTHTATALNHFVFERGLRKWLINLHLH